MTSDAEHRGRRADDIRLYGEHYDEIADGVRRCLVASNVVHYTEDFDLDDLDDEIVSDPAWVCYNCHHRFDAHGMDWAARCQADGCNCAAMTTEPVQWSTLLPKFTAPRGGIKFFSSEGWKR